MSNDKTMEADKARVLAVYPDAELYIDVFRNGACAVGSDSVGVTIGAQKWSKAEAWADAASRLPAGDAGQIDWANDEQVVRAALLDVRFITGKIRTADYLWDGWHSARVNDPRIEAFERQHNPAFAAPPEQEGDGDGLVSDRDVVLRAASNSGLCASDDTAELSPVAPAPEGEEGFECDASPDGFHAPCKRKCGDTSSHCHFCGDDLPSPVPNPKAEGVEPDEREAFEEWWLRYNGGEETRETAYFEAVAHRAWIAATRASLSNQRLEAVRQIVEDRDTMMATVTRKALRKALDKGVSAANETVMFARFEEPCVTEDRAHRLVKGQPCCGCCGLTAKVYAVSTKPAAGEEVGDA